MNQRKNQAIDLMIEDLYTVHSDIRLAAKELGCESELEKLKTSLIEYLYSQKQ